MACSYVRPSGPRTARSAASVAAGAPVGAAGSIVPLSVSPRFFVGPLCLAAPDQGLPEGLATLSPPSLGSGRVALAPSARGRLAGSRRRTGRRRAPAALGPAATAQPQLVRSTVLNRDLHRGVNRLQVCTCKLCHTRTRIADAGSRCGAGTVTDQLQSAIRARTHSRRKSGTPSSSTRGARLASRSLFRAPSRRLPSPSRGMTLRPVERTVLQVDRRPVNTPTVPCGRSGGASPLSGRDGVTGAADAALRPWRARSGLTSDPGVASHRFTRCGHRRGATSSRRARVASAAAHRLPLPFSWQRRLRWSYGFPIRCPRLLRCSVGGRLSRP